VGWETGNNFATYIRSASTGEDALIAGLRSGDVYMADPVLFRSRLAFQDRDGHRMGQKVPLVGAGAGTAEVALVLDAAQPEWRLHWVVDGERQPAIALGAGPIRQVLSVSLDRPTFVRAEIWDTTRAPAGQVEAGATGRCIALTNPIWYVAAQA
jgi:hypothetical protein